MSEATSVSSAPAVPAALAALIARHSLGGKHLVEPGPDAAALAWMAEAALHAPDHAELAPFRFAVVQGSARQALARLFTQAALDAGKDADAAALDAERAARAPVTVAVLARIDLGHPLVPAHEQWMAVGGALANFLNAAHLLGYAGKMLSGAKVRHAVLQQAFCQPGETLVGWVALGTAARPVGSRAPKADVGAVCAPWQAPVQAG
ncbi:MAG: nitroreductase family protein [Rubrivivax sp.]